MKGMPKMPKMPKGMKSGMPKGTGMDKGMSKKMPPDMQRMSISKACKCAPKECAMRKPV